MTPPWRAQVLAAFAALGASAAFADSAKVSDLVDDLQRIQVKIAQGDKAAYAAELNQLKTIGAAIATASPETWKDKREADSLVLYILSGGSLADVASLLRGDAVIESERSLARGALAYVTNHEAEAIALLGQTDLTALDARLAGEVAFARSVLKTKRDAKAAVELLDWSRLLAPGGLVEEAALWREIALLAEAKDVSRVAMLTGQYVTRFVASLYAADFLRDLAGAVARLGLADEAANYKLLSNAVSSLPLDRRRAFLLCLAKSGLVSARFAAAAAAATEALESSKADSPEAMRARLISRPVGNRSTRSLPSRRASTPMGTRTETRLPPTVVLRARHGDRRKASATGAARTMRAYLAAALHGVPLNVLYSVGLTETGRRGALSPTT